MDSVCWLEQHDKNFTPGLNSHSENDISGNNVLLNDICKLGISYWGMNAQDKITS